MEIRKNRNKIKIAVLFLVLLVVEIVCMYLINSRNIRIISMSGKDNYESAEWNNYTSFELTDCEGKGDYLEVTGENPQIVLKDVQGYVDAVQIASDLSLTFCGGIEFQYDNGTGYQSVESVELSQDNFTVVIKERCKKTENRIPGYPCESIRTDCAEDNGNPGKSVGSSFCQGVAQGLSDGIPCGNGCYGSYPVCSFCKKFCQYIPNCVIGCYFVCTETRNRFGICE